MIIITRSYLLTNIPEESDNKLTDAKLQGYAAVLSIGSTRCKANTLGMWKYYLKIWIQIYCTLSIFTFDLSGHSIMQNLPSSVQTISETWNSIHTNEFPNIGSWVCKDHVFWMLCWLYYTYLKNFLWANNNSEPHTLFFFLREMHLPMIPFHQRATSVPSRQLTLEHWVVNPCLLLLLLNTFCSLWFASLVTSLCKYLSCNKQ